MSLANLGILCSATGRLAESLGLMGQGQGIEERLIGQVFSIGSETQRLAYVEGLRGNLYAYLSLVRQHFSQDPTAVAGALERVLRRKAIGAEALAAQRDAVLGGRHPHLAPRLEALTALRRQIAARKGRARGAPPTPRVMERAARGPGVGACPPDPGDAPGGADEGGGPGGGGEGPARGLRSGRIRALRGVRL
jgi:hypothetical protein